MRSPHDTILVRRGVPTGEKSPQVPSKVALKRRVVVHGGSLTSGESKKSTKREHGKQLFDVLPHFTYLDTSRESQAMRIASTIEQIEEAIRETAFTLGARKAIIFGSFARGTQSRRSDVDVVFVKTTSERFVERPDAYMKMLHERIHGRAVDVLVYTPEELDTIRERPFIARILREGKVVYES